MALVPWVVSLWEAASAQPLTRSEWCGRLLRAQPQCNDSASVGFWGGGFGWHEGATQSQVLGCSPHQQATQRRWIFASPVQSRNHARLHARAAPGAGA